MARTSRAFAILTLFFMWACSAAEPPETLAVHESALSCSGFPGSWPAASELGTSTAWGSPLYNTRACATERVKGKACTLSQYSRSSYASALEALIDPPPYDEIWARASGALPYFETSEAATTAKVEIVQDFYTIEDVDVFAHAEHYERCTLRVKVNGVTKFLKNYGPDNPDLCGNGSDVPPPPVSFPPPPYYGLYYYRYGCTGAGETVTASVNCHNSFGRYDVEHESYVCANYSE